MLLLERAVDDRVAIIDRKSGRVLAQVMLVNLTDNTAKLGFEAPDNILVLRNELLTRSQGGNNHGKKTQ